MARLNLEIITAERVVYSEEVDMVVAPGAEGQFAIMPNHAPFMTMLEPGELLVRNNNEETFLAIGGGFLEVLQNAVTVLADTAERAEEIDVARAEQAKLWAQEQLVGKSMDMDLAGAEAAMRRSLARLKVAENRTKRRQEKR